MAVPAAQAGPAPQALGLRGAAAAVRLCRRRAGVFRHRHRRLDGSCRCHTWLLDLLIASNLACSVAVLLVALYVGEALKIAAFPTLLLITTLFRLALNVSSTRLILLQADAGQVIKAFGQFVVRGNYVVGAVIFLILTIIQFVVIAKGAERVAEVGARFTLDAMPGKQMAIDAELRTGSIDGNEARRRRRSLLRESQFYGAMDGAMKFVKGEFRSCSRGVEAPNEQEKPPSSTAGPVPRAKPRLKPSRPRSSAAAPCWPATTWPRCPTARARTAGSSTTG